MKFFDNTNRDIMNVLLDLIHHNLTLNEAYNILEKLKGGKEK